MGKIGFVVLFRSVKSEPSITHFSNRRVSLVCEVDSKMIEKKFEYENLWFGSCIIMLKLRAEDKVDLLICFLITPQGK
jgi:hypothetical protein